MKHFSKRPLRVIAVAAFMVALGYGVSTNSEFSESGKIGNVNLSVLSNASANVEESADYSCTVSYDCGNGKVECTGTSSCSRGHQSVTCDGNTTFC